MKGIVAHKKEEHEKMKSELDDAKNDTNRAAYRIKTLDKKLQSSKAQMDEKLEEIDKLYDETDMLKNTLE